MKFAGTVIGLILAFNHIVAAEYVFEFGVNNGQIIYNRDGNIPLLTWNTDISVPKFRLLVTVKENKPACPKNINYEACEVHQSSGAACEAKLGSPSLDLQEIPPGMSVMYVKVTVGSLSPPKVDYDPLYNLVSIKFSWTQVTLSSYNILVKAAYIQ